MVHMCTDTALNYRNNSIRQKHFKSAKITYRKPLTMETTNQSHSQATSFDGSPAINKLHMQEELALVCETILILHQCKQGEQQAWEVVDCGIPAIVSSKKGLEIYIGSFETGEAVHKIPVNSSSQYSVCKDHFHVLTNSKSDHEGTTHSECEAVTVYGLSFTNISIAKKVAKAVKQLEKSLAGCDPLPATKRPRLSEEVSNDDRVLAEKHDIPPEGEQSDKEDEGTGEGVDAAFGTLRKSIRHKKTKVSGAGDKEHGRKEISSPTDFKHLTHVSIESTVGHLKAVISGEVKSTNIAPVTQQASEVDVTPAKSRKEELHTTEVQTCTHEPTTRESEVQATTSCHPVPNPSLLGNKLSIPDPPMLSDHEALLTQIAQFDRKNLRPVSPGEVETRCMPDSPTQTVDLNSLLKSGLEHMRSKLQLSFSRLASITSTGEDEFDDFD